MSEREIWLETKETIIACKASPIFPKTRKGLKDLIRHIRSVIIEDALCDRKAA